MYKNTFALFTAEAWKKNDVEVIEYGSEIWANQKHLEKKLDISNIADRTQYCSSNFKKMRCEIQVWNTSMETINLVKFLLKIL